MPIRESTTLWRNYRPMNSCTLWIILFAFVVVPFAIAQNEAGEICRSRNGDCKSNACRNGICVSSSKCHPIQHKYGEKPLDADSLTLVFVGSGFATFEEWHAQANATFAAMSTTDFFREFNNHLNVFRVDDLPEPFCVNNCQDVPQLVCCDMFMMTTLSNQCFPSSDRVQTVVIHNDQTFGRAGYTFDNIVTTTVHPDVPEIVGTKPWLGEKWVAVADNLAKQSAAANPSPTRSPTKTPTMAPTLPPTPLPTTTPTSKPTIEPTPNPTLSPTMNPTTTPTAKPTPLPTLEQTPNPTLSPTMNPTIAPTRPPSKSPTLASTLSATVKPDVVEGTQITGEVCSQNLDCRSNTCRNGVCMASSECYPVKHTFGSPFDKNKINIVFVASAFANASHKKWRIQVNKTYTTFENYNMFSKDIEQLNVFLVDPDQLDSSFCKLGCHGVERMLCCDIEKAHSMSSKCFPVGSNLQTVVIHNSRKYGGAGYTSANIATVSTHSLASLVAVHELGHSLFELGDEYSYGPTSAMDPNCDSTETCGKWSDLVGNTPVGYEPVRCIPGCSGNNYYIGARSFMQNLSLPVGAVNERFSCCTYQALTKSMPPYCDVFNIFPNYLFKYCKNNDYQSFGSANYEIEPLLAIPSNATNVDIDAHRSKYVYVSDPVLVSVTSRTRRKTGKAVFKSKLIRLKPGLFLRSQVEGDFFKAKAAGKLGIDSLLKVLVSYKTRKEALLFSQNTAIEAPLPEPKADGAIHPGPEEPRIFFEKADVIEVVLDTKGRRIKSVRSKVIKTR